MRRVKMLSKIYLSFLVQTCSFGVGSDSLIPISFDQMNHVTNHMIEEMYVTWWLAGTVLAYLIL